MARLDQVLSEVALKQDAAARSLLNPDDPASALGKALSTLRHGQAEQLALQTALGERVASREAAFQAREEIWESTAIKGLAYEDEVTRAVLAEASRWEDPAEPVGRVRGSQATMTGDVVVEVAGAGRYVVEVKDRRLGMSAALAEARGAMSNREAAACVMVFSSEERSPARTLLATYGEIIVVVFDKAEPDPTALRLGLCLARARVLAQARPAGSEGPDVVRMQEHLEQAESALRRCTEIRKAHGAARNAVARAGDQLETLSQDINEALDRLRQELC